MGVLLELAVKRMARSLRRREALGEEVVDLDGTDLEQNLAASAVSGQTPPAGPQWLRGLAPLTPSALDNEKPLCARLDGFTLHAATRAGGLDEQGREALLAFRSIPIRDRRSRSEN